MTWKMSVPHIISASLPSFCQNYHNWWKYDETLTKNFAQFFSERRCSKYSLKDRREMLTARCFKKQVLASNALLHYLLPEPRDNDIIRSLRNSQPFPSIRARTTKFHKSFLPYCLANFTGALRSCTVFYCFNVLMFHV